MPRLSAILARALDQDPEITGVTADSRKVQPGFLFAALPGSQADGGAYASQAVKAGAAAVVYGRDPLQARTDPWLALAALQASGQSRVQEHDRAAEPPCSAPGCPYEGRAPCVQPFCLALRVQPAPLAAPTGPG